MRAALLIASATSVTGANQNWVQLEAFSCGNTRRPSPFHSASSDAAASTISMITADQTNNIGSRYESSSCMPEEGNLPSPFKTVDSCVIQCKSARACSTKVWPEQCDQGCEQDCYQFQSAPANPIPRWSMHTVPSTYTGNINIDFTVMTGGVGRTYQCSFTMAEIPAGPGAIYCVGLTTGAAKLASWPDFGQMDQLGQPWIKISMTKEVPMPMVAAGVAGLASATGVLVDSPDTTGVVDATPITGTKMHTSCDGHCGTFAPAFGASCTAQTAAEVAGFGPGWHPSSATDCYCSCTTDCQTVGDCCDDYSLCSATDLTIVGGVVQTLAPTNGNAGGTAGDPFTEHAGKRTQFYLPLGRRVALLHHKDVSIFGEAKPSSKKNDDQQWFKGFEIRYKDVPTVTVEVRDAAPLMQKYAEDSEEKEGVAKMAGVPDDVDVLAALRDRIARAKIEMAVTSDMRSASKSDEVDLDKSFGGRKEMRASNHPLSTINVTIEGRHMTREATSVSAADGAIVVQIAQDQKKRIGNGFMESVWIETPGLGMELQSTAAQKFSTMEDKVRHMHINLKFTELNATACTGPLPEIWGVQPMTADTIKMLSPMNARASASGWEHPSA